MTPKSWNNKLMTSKSRNNIKIFMLDMVCKNSLFLSWLLHKNIKGKMCIYVTITNFVCLSGNKFTNWCPSSRRVFKRIKVIFHCSRAVHLERNILFKEPLNRNESGRFGALKSDSTHHFFKNSCTKSGLLRFSQFSGCWLILSVYIIMSFDFPFIRLFGVR
jgi:hypothetical protein